MQRLKQHALVSRDGVSSASESFQQILIAVQDVSHQE
jgi:hypothetical protein